MIKPGPTRAVASLCIALMMQAYTCSGRTFTDVDGRKIQAEVVSASETHVLLKTGARTFKVPLARLSEADRKYVSELRSKSVRKRAGSEAKAPAESESNERTEEPAPTEAEPEPARPAEASPPDGGKPEEGTQEETGEGALGRPGVISKPIPVKKGDKNLPASFLLYLPPDYKADGLWPVCFIAGPWGAQEEHVQLHRDGADLCGMILVMPVEARFDNQRSREVIETVIDDVLTRLPIDPERVYASGYHMQGEQILKIAQDRSDLFAGVVSAGSGLIFNGGFQLGKKTIFYGLCGSNSARRYEMALSLAKVAQDKESVVRYFPGSDGFAPRRETGDALLWLNACHFKKVSSREKEKMAKRDAFATRLVSAINEVRQTDEERAYDYLLVLELLKNAGVAKTQAPLLRRDLEKSKAVVAYKAGLKLLEKFIERYFATDPRDYEKREVNKSQKRTADKLAEEYKDSFLGPLFQRMGNPAEIPGA